MAQAADLLAPITAESLSDVGKELYNLAARIPDPKGMLLTREQRSQRAVELIGVALGLVLIHHGWTLVAQPGVFCLKQDADEINSTIVADVLAGEIVCEAWIERCQGLGIAGSHRRKSPHPRTPRTGFRDVCHSCCYAVSLDTCEVVKLQYPPP